MSCLSGRMLINVPLTLMRLTVEACLWTMLWYTSILVENLRFTGMTRFKCVKMSSLVLAEFVNSWSRRQVGMVWQFTRLLILVIVFHLYLWLLGPKDDFKCETLALNRAWYAILVVSSWLLTIFFDWVLVNMNVLLKMHEKQVFI